MMQTWVKLNSGPNFVPPPHKTFFLSFSLFQAIILWTLKENKWTELEKIVKNLISDLISACLANLCPQFFLWVLPLLMLDIAASYHCMQFQGKLIIQTQENDKNPRAGPNLGPFCPNSGRQFFFFKIWLCQSLDIMISYHHVQYQKKLMIFTKMINGFQLLTIFTKNSILDVKLGSEYASETLCFILHAKTQLLNFISNIF